MNLQVFSVFEHTVTPNDLDLAYTYSWVIANVVSSVSTQYRLSFPTCK